MSEQQVMQVLGKIVNAFTFISKWITDKLIDLFKAMGATITARLSGLITFLIICLLVFLAWKYIGEKALKLIIIIVLALLIISFFVPW